MSTPRNPLTPPQEKSQHELTVYIMPGYGANDASIVKKRDAAQSASSLIAHISMVPRLLESGRGMVYLVRRTAAMSPEPSGVNFQ